jgi:hypothetical protein
MLKDLAARIAKESGHQALSRPSVRAKLSEMFGQTQSMNINPP